MSDDDRQFGQVGPGTGMVWSMVEYEADGVKESSARCGAQRNAALLRGSDGEVADKGSMISG